jgi:hypothetical protein
MTSAAVTIRTMTAITPGLLFELLLSRFIAEF